MLKIRKVKPANIVTPIESLEHYFRAGGVTIIQAAFSHSFFVDPSAVRARTPWFPDRARYSRTHYPGKNKGEYTTWEFEGNTRTVRLDDNQYAQNAWTRYTGCPIQRGTGYSLRHVWGQPWDPEAYTAGWNFCYMPFWAGMLTENQHCHEPLRSAIQQASWDLYFRDDPSVEPPSFVQDPGVDLNALLMNTPVLVMEAEDSISKPRNGDTSIATQHNPHLPDSDLFEAVKAARTRARQSWSNIAKATLALQGRPHKSFGTPNVEASSKSTVRRILRETGLSEDELEELLTDAGVDMETAQ